MFFIYAKLLGSTFLTKEGEEVELVWITEREIHQTIPSGSTILGQILWNESGQMPDAQKCFLGDHKISGLACLRARLEFQQAWRRKEKIDELPHLATPFDYMPAKVCRPVLIRGRRIIMIHSFRESEAAQAAFDSGFRNPTKGPFYTWPALGASQEQEAAKVTA